jgi:hypothetical protein
MLENYLGMEREGPMDPHLSIECAKRDTLEDFTTTLGRHDFVISPYEYTLAVELEGWGRERRCLSAFVGRPEWADELKYIVLRSTFMRG